MRPKLNVAHGALQVGNFKCPTSSFCPVVPPYDFLAAKKAGGESDLL